MSQRVLLDVADTHTATERLRYCLDRPQKCDSVKHCTHKTKGHFLCSPYLKIIFFKLCLVYVTGFCLIYSYANRDFILLPWKAVKKIIVPYKITIQQILLLFFPINLCAEMTDLYSSTNAQDQVSDNLSGYKATHYAQTRHHRTVGYRKPLD